jgi:hypothetical protein
MMSMSPIQSSEGSSIPKRLTWLRWERILQHMAFELENCLFMGLQCSAWRDITHTMILSISAIKAF